jgi:hypothetical protein
VQNWVSRGTASAKERKHRILNAFTDRLLRKIFELKGRTGGRTDRNRKIGRMDRADTIKNILICTQLSFGRMNTCQTVNTCSTSRPNTRARHNNWIHNFSRTPQHMRVLGKNWDRWVISESILSGWNLKIINWIQVPQERTKQQIALKTTNVKLIDWEGYRYFQATWTIISLSEKKTPFPTSY